MTDAEIASLELEKNAIRKVYTHMHTHTHTHTHTHATLHYTTFH
jgi:hypothetical protein